MMELDLDHMVVQLRASRIPPEHAWAGKIGVVSKAGSRTFLTEGQDFLSQRSEGNRWWGRLFICGGGEQYGRGGVGSCVRWRHGHKYRAWSWSDGVHGLQPMTQTTGR